MPYSSEEGKDFVRSFLSQFHDIRHVVDIGPGAGVYYDLLNDPLKVEWWTAVEIWPPYIEQFRLREKYDEVIIADAYWLDWDLLGTPDAVILGDVVEHMSLAAAEKVIAAATRISRFVIISLPIIHYPQGTEMGNPYEAHVTHWTPETVKETLLDGYDIVQYAEGSVVGVYILKGERS